MPACLEKIIDKTVYCKCVIAHYRSSPFVFVLVNKILGEDFYFSNIKVYNWQLGLFKLNAEENPHSPRTYFALGEAYFQTGDKKQAIINFEKALEINPKFYEVIERLKLAGKN
jgi:tetratricopeptide (TPR) repeat protein